MAHAVAIVTGGSRGIGREISRALARRGSAVVVVYMGDQLAAEAVVEEILVADGTALAVRADVTDELDVERLFDETEAMLGSVDLVVHGAMRDPAVVDRLAARRLAPGGTIVGRAELAALLEAVRPFTRGG